MAQYPVVHVEIPTTDPAASERFYAGVFGWEVEQHPEMDYATFVAEGGPGGGFPKIDGQLAKAGDVRIYLATDNIEETLARATDMGAETVLGKTEIPGYGYMALFRDPFGNTIGLFSM